MSMTPPQVFAAPFDAIAARYDETFTSSKIGQVQRAAVWNELAKTFSTGVRTLEIGCGTAEDASFLAELGVRVVACDSSLHMIDVASRKIAGRGLQTLVQARLLRAEEFSSLPSDEPFDGAFSNFGVLNCVVDLRKLALDLARLLKPGANVLFCWMGPHCLWEMAWYLAQGNREKAFRRLQRHGVAARVADGSSVRVHYPSVRQLVKTFAPEFRLKSVKGIGIAVPPSYAESWAQRHPRWLQFCEGADSYLAKCPGIRGLGDHVVVRLQREGGD